MPKNPADAANVTTEEILNEMESEITSVYAEAHAEMVEKLLNFLFTIDDINDVRQIYKFFRMKNKMKLEALKAGRISQKEYNAWKAKAIMAEKSWLPVQQTLADDLTHSREIAASIINDKKCDIYALNYNYATYEIEKGIGASTSFALYDHDTVERLIAKNPKLLPTYAINNAKDAAWNAKHIRQAVTQGILQGESNQEIAARMQKVCDMSKNASIRTARTATTCAQNSGRIDGYKRAQEMGIDVKQIWISTLDGRTRHQHRELMGQKREIGKPFQVDGYEIMFPGDPNASAFLVYNCRCTLIADVDGANYDLENRIEQNLKEKDLTWDEWIKEQPLPRHYDEDLKSYLKRYKEHHKKMKFSDWLEEQAMPDILITKAWSDKKMSNIYNMIKEKNITDANKFYKELGKLGKPSEVWNKYLLGQLDAIDLKQFEEILKKYLPKETAPVATKTIAVHQKAIEAEKQIKYAKSDPMSFDDADMHHVNPNYKGNSGIYSKNCQTCAMTYEARRQGYDVVALGKDPTHSHTYALQTEVGKDQAVAWINKTTGEMPVHLTCSSKLQTPGKYKFLEDTVGHNGERYTLSVRWKGGGAHVINMDRDANGVLRLIDNQRGINEKHIWTGEKEIKQYLDSVKNIKYVLRVDDCIPNPKYFNMITKEAKKSAPKPKVELTAEIKSVDTTGKIIDPKKKSTYQSLLNEYDLTESDIKNAGGWEEFKKKYGKTYGNEWVSKIDALYIDKPIDIIDKSLFANKKMSAVYVDIKKTDVKTANQFYKELQKMGKPSDVWDKYMKGELSDVDVQKIEKHLAKKYSALEEAMPGESVTGLDIDALSKKKVTGVYNDLVADGDKTTANKFYNELKKIATTKGYKSQSDVWKKYLNGELDFDDIEKIDKYVIKKYQTKVSAPGIEPAVNPYAKMTTSELTADPKINDHEIFQHLIEESNKHNILWNDYVTKWANGEIDDLFLDEKLLGVTAKKVEINYNKLTIPSVIQNELEKEISSEAADEFMNLIVDMGLKYNKSYMYIWKKYKKKELTESEMKQIDDIVGKLDKYTIKGTSDVVMTDELKSDISKFLNKIENTDPELAEEIWKHMDGTYIDADKAWTEYWDKKWSDPDLDDLIKQTGFEPPKVTTIKTKADLPEKVTDLPDQMKVFNHIHANGLVKKTGANDWVDYYGKYKAGDIDDPELDKILGIKSTTKSKADLPDNYVDAIKSLSDADKTKLSNAWAVGNSSISPQHYYTKWKNGEVSDPVFDEVLLGKKSGSNINYNSLPSDYNKIWSDLMNISSKTGFDFDDTLLKIANANNLFKQDAWYKYQAKELTAKEMEELDKFIEKLDGYKVKPSTPKTTSVSTSATGTTVVDMNALSKKVTTAYNKIKDEIGTSDANKFYNELKKIGKNKGYGKQSDVWNKYLLGQLDTEDVAKIDKHLIKIKDYTKVEEPFVPVVDIDAIKNKKMSQFYNELKAENTSNANKFYNELKKHGKPSEVWTEYIKGELPEDAAKKIDEYVIKKYSKGVKASAAQKQQDQIVKTADGVDIHDLSKLAKTNKDLYDEVFNVLHGMKGSPGTNWKKYLTGKLDDHELDKILVKHNVASEDIVKKVEQQKELDAAKEELEKAKAALPENKKYSGIWKDEVSLSDYATKKKTLAAKKVYLEDELQKAKDLKNQNPHQPGTSQYDGYIKWNESQIEKFEKLLVSIDEFERLGKEYEKAYKAVEEAQKKVDELTPTGFTSDAYTKERKDAALWAKNTREADDLLRNKCGEVWRDASKLEKDAIYDYTVSYSKFNEPLRGIQYGTSAYKGVGKTDLNAGSKRNGKQLNAMTDIIERSTYDEDFWFQRGVSSRGMDKFFNVDIDILRYGTEKELQDALLGTTPIEYGFMSAGVAKGKGFGGDIILNIYAPRGTKMMYAEPFSAYGHGGGRSWDGRSTQSSYGSESEIIFQQGTQFRVTKVEKSGGRIYVDIEVIDQLEPQRWVG